MKRMNEIFMIKLHNEKTDSTMAVNALSYIFERSGKDFFIIEGNNIDKNITSKINIDIDKYVIVKCNSIPQELSHISVLIENMDVINAVEEKINKLFYM